MLRVVTQILVLMFCIKRKLISYLCYVLNVILFIVNSGQQIAAQVEASNPALVETLRRTINPQDVVGSEEGQEVVNSGDKEREDTK